MTTTDIERWCAVTSAQKMPVTPDHAIARFVRFPVDESPVDPAAITTVVDRWLKRNGDGVMPAIRDQVAPSWALCQECGAVLDWRTPVCRECQSVYCPF